MYDPDAFARKKLAEAYGVNVPEHLICPHKEVTQVMVGQGLVARCKQCGKTSP